MAQVVTIPTRPARVAALNHRYRHHAAIRVLGDALHDPELGRVAMVSSFGADSVALLHMISLVDRNTPVLFIDTQMLFEETMDAWTLAGTLVILGSNAYIAHREATLARRAASGASSSAVKPGE